MVNANGAAWVPAGARDSIRSSIRLGTPAWYAWLETATLFSFVSEHGTFTARQERRQRGRWYWKAYRTQQGTLTRAYLGKTEHLALERLEQVAQTLIERGKPAEQSPAGRSGQPPAGHADPGLPAAPDAPPSAERVSTLAAELQGFPDRLSWSHC